MPVVDILIIFGETANEVTAYTCMMVLNTNIDVETVPIGTLANSVIDVREFREKEILALPSVWI